MDFGGHADLLEGLYKLFFPLFKPLILLTIKLSHEGCFAVTGLYID